MRGRLPETRPQQAQHHSQHLPRSVALPDWGFDPVTWKSLHATDTLEEPTDEEFSIQEYMYEFKADIQKVLSQSLIKIAPYSPTLNERLALLSIARVVQIEMHSLQDALSRCGRPPYQRGDSYISAPNWDSAYLTDIINAWNEPIALEPDYYLLKAMCLYEMGTSIQVSVLGQEKVQKFMNMALILTQKGERILKTKLGIGDCSDKIWRYQTMMSYVYQHQAEISLFTFKKLQESTGVQDQGMLNTACDIATRALHCFRRGMRCHPNVNNSSGTSSEEPFKDQEWIKMADLANSCFQLANDFTVRKAWYQHTLGLLQGALYENCARAGRLLEQVARVHLEYAVWIHEQKEVRLVVVPKPSPLFKEMRYASIAALIYASQSIATTGLEESRPKQFCLIIDTLHMMSLVCLDPNLIHLYIREASRWIDQLKKRFPQEPINSSYLSSANFMASKDRAIQAIAQGREAHSPELNKALSFF